MSESASRPRGRPRRLPDAISKKHDGAPHLKIRMEPDLWHCVQAQGGAQWVHDLLLTARAKGALDDHDLAPYEDEEISPEEEAAVRDALEDTTPTITWEQAQAELGL